ncbi:hypothetical protein J6590_012231 [Homalodisca vitripennis]|nr:hypothetical protein J6590_012231 [Homalodisca vitripennis]
MEGRDANSRLSNTWGGGIGGGGTATPVKRRRELPVRQSDAPNPNMPASGTYPLWAQLMPLSTLLCMRCGGRGEHAARYGGGEAADCDRPVPAKTGYGLDKGRALRIFPAAKKSVRARPRFFPFLCDRGRSLVRHWCMSNARRRPGKNWSANYVDAIASPPYNMEEPSNNLIYNFALNFIFAELSAAGASVTIASRGRGYDVCRSSAVSALSTVSPKF